jgi:hypothetical protein
MTGRQTASGALATPYRSPGPPSSKGWNQGQVSTLGVKTEGSMPTVIERVMQTYGMLVNLTPEQEQASRERVTKFLEGKTGDERSLAVEAIKFLRGSRISRTRHARP